MRRLALLLGLCGCQSLPHVPDSTLAQVAARPGAYLTGAPTGLHPVKVLNEEDFIYDLKFSSNSQKVALSRLGMKSFDVLVWQLSDPLKEVSSAAVNPHEFDVESVDFSPDGKWVAAVSRDGSVRAFDAASGQSAGAWLTEEPLVSLAFSPDGGSLALGSEKGLVTVLKVEPKAGKLLVRVASEVRAHTAAVRGLAFAPDGRLFSGGWDKTVAVFATKEQPASTGAAAVHFERKGGFSQLRGTFNDVASVLFALDARMPQVVVMKASLAQAVGVDPSRLTDTVNVTSSFGTQVARVVHGVRLSFKGMKLDNVDAAVCDACIPADALAVLGQGFSDAVEVAFDETLGQALLKRRGAEGAPGESLLALTEQQRFSFPAFVNDLTVDRAGKVLGVAFSQTRAERTREVYEREKKGTNEPEREWDVGARVDANTGAVLAKLRGHHGVVATAGISADGATLATGGWDKRLLLHVAGEAVAHAFGWAVRRVRFSADGRWLGAAAWTPQNPLGDHKSKPSAVVWELSYAGVDVAR